ncbi:MAG TPA: Rho termination factor N-terminal domain-containing protein [Acidimicrobiales bacterium]|nr:Rho termination factor N-terminal domain-containing protein [Acidimicrobiales bacterium]
MNEETPLLPSEDPVEEAFDLFGAPSDPPGEPWRDTAAQPDGTYVSRGAPDRFVVAEAPDATGTSKEELLDLTKDELYEKAKEADISGRSSMNKEQLAEELASR